MILHRVGLQIYGAAAALEQLALQPADVALERGGVQAAYWVRSSRLACGLRALEASSRA